MDLIKTITTYNLISDGTFSIKSGKIPILSIEFISTDIIICVDNESNKISMQLVKTIYNKDYYVTTKDLNDYFT